QRLELAPLKRFHVSVPQVRPFFSYLLDQTAKALGGDLDLEHLPDRPAAFVERLHVARRPVHSLENPWAEALSPEVQLEVQREKRLSAGDAVVLVPLQRR